MSKLQTIHLYLGERNDDLSVLYVLNTCIAVLKKDKKVRVLESDGHLLQIALQEVSEHMMGVNDRHIVDYMLKQVSRGLPSDKYDGMYRRVFHKYWKD